VKLAMTAEQGHDHITRDMVAPSHPANKMCRNYLCKNDNACDWLAGNEMASPIFTDGGGACGTRSFSSADLGCKVILEEETVVKKTKRVFVCAAGLLSAADRSTDGCWASITEVFNKTSSRKRKATELQTAFTELCDSNEISAMNVQARKIMEQGYIQDDGQDCSTSYSSESDVTYIERHSTAVMTNIAVLDGFVRSKRYVAAAPGARADREARAAKKVLERRRKADALAMSQNEEMIMVNLKHATKMINETYALENTTLILKAEEQRKLANERFIQLRNAEDERGKASAERFAEMKKAEEDARAAANARIAIMKKYDDERIAEMKKAEEAMEKAANERIRQMEKAEVDMKTNADARLERMENANVAIIEEMKDASERNIRAKQSEGNVALSHVESGYNELILAGKKCGDDREAEYAKHIEDIEEKRAEREAISFGKICKAVSKRKDSHLFHQ
jgi:hypothetical protein